MLTTRTKNFIPWFLLGFAGLMGAVLANSTGETARQILTAAPPSGAVNLASATGSEGTSTALRRADATLGVTGVLPQLNGGTGGTGANTWPSVQTFSAGFVSAGQFVIGCRTTVSDANTSPAGPPCPIIEYTSLTAARTVTLPTSSVSTDQWVVIKDGAGTASATISISVVGATGNVDGSAGAKVAITTAFGSAKFYWNGTQWLSATGLPKPVEIATFVPGLWTANQVLMRTGFTSATVVKSGLPSIVTWVGTTATASTTASLTKRTQANSTTALGTLVWAIGARNPTVTFSADVSFAAGDMLEITGPAGPDTTLTDVTVNIQAWRQ